MNREWTADNLAYFMTVTDQERAWVYQREPHNALAQAVLLKFFQYQGRFPFNRREVPTAIIAFLAEQLDVFWDESMVLNITGRDAYRLRKAVRDYLGFVRISAEMKESLTQWLIRHPVMRHDHNVETLKELAHHELWERRVEPPSPPELNRLVRSAIAQFENDLFVCVEAELSSETKLALDALIATRVPDTEADQTFQHSLFLSLKTDPRRVGVTAMLDEIGKLDTLNTIPLSESLADLLPPKLLSKYRQRAAIESPYGLRHDHSPTVRYTLLAAFCWERRREVTDNLVDLLDQIVHKFSSRAEHKVEAEFVADIKRVRGKHNLLFRIAEAVLDNPDGVIREVLFPLIGEHTFEELLAEYRTSGGTYQRQVYGKMRSSYQHSYRRILPELLRVLTFRSNNVLHRPVIEALAVVKEHLGSQAHTYPSEVANSLPIQDVVPPAWQDAVVEYTAEGERRINRINYELCVLHTLRDKLRHRLVWVKGANRYRDPDADTPRDFDEQRAGYYQQLDLPLDSATFVDAVQSAMMEALEQLNEGMPTNPLVEIQSRSGGWIKVSPLPKQTEPPHLHELHREVNRIWPQTSLLDILKEVDFRLNLTPIFKSAASSTRLTDDQRQKRLLLCLYGLGTNIGIKGVSKGHHGEIYGDLLYVKKRFIYPSALRHAAAEVANATFAIRLSHIWGEGTSTCGSDSRRFQARGENLRTGWHARYRTRGVLVYWHVERRSLAVYSQVLSPSSSEAAAMIQGVMHHLTTLEIDRQIVDTHGQSEVAFAFCHLLGFDLMPRLKRIHAQKLYRPVTGHPDAYPHLLPVMTRPINWAIIRQQYDEMVKFASAIYFGTADADSILKRFTRANSQHPTYQALVELGRAIKTAFLCQYLHSAQLRREILEALNIVEHWHSANRFIFFGNNGEFTYVDRFDQEISALALHLLQNSLVHINTLMVQQVLGQPRWYERMTEADWRGLTPLFYEHVTPYGSFDLDLNTRLILPTG